MSTHPRPASRSRAGRLGSLAVLLGVVALSACDTMTVRGTETGSAASRAGAAVDISEDGLTMAVGEPLARGRTIQSAGAVSVYVRTSTTASWTKQTTLSPAEPDKNSLFGSNLALSDDGSRLVVGAPEYLDRGAAFVFTRSDETWDDGVRLVGFSGSLEYFGSSSAISGNGNIVAVGQRRDEVARNNVAYKAAGRVWMYEYVGTNWVIHNQPISSIPQENAFFGWSVALSRDGSELIVGAPGHDEYSDITRGFVTDSGRMEIFKRSGNTWNYSYLLDPGDEALGQGHFMGRAVAMSRDDSTIVIGIPGIDQTKTDVGGVAVYVRKGNGWDKLTYAANSGFENAAAGTSVAVSGDASHILIGLPGYEGGYGAVALLEKKNGVYGLVEGYGDKSAPSAGGALGTSVALAGDEMVWAAGMPGLSSNSGGFRAFDNFSVPGAPTSPTATAGGGAALVQWTAPASNGGLSGDYLVTSNPGGKTCTAVGTSCLVSGLENGTAYTFSVVARNAIGSGVASVASSPVTPLGGGANLGTVPGSPRDVTVTPGWKRATVSWAAPLVNGGQAVQAYEVTATPGGKKCVTTIELSCVITGLRAKKQYRFSVIAVNSVGASTPASTERFGLQPKVSLRGGPKASTLAAWQGISSGVGEVTSMRLRGKAAKANCNIVDGRLVAKVAGAQCKVTVKSRYLKTLSRTVLIQTVRR